MDATSISAVVRCVDLVEIQRAVSDLGIRQRKLVEEGVPNVRLIDFLTVVDEPILLEMRKIR